MQVVSPETLGEGDRIVIATSNPGKVREIRQILAAHTPAEVAPVGADAVSFPAEGDDYEANAIGKALAVSEQLGAVAIGDDSGLEVSALGGAPGVRSARYGGAGLDDRGRVDRLLRELEGVGASDRTARFVCHVALAFPGGACFVAFGECRGEILTAPRGESGFGYDPVFLVRGGDRTMAELPAPEKNRVSHRAEALRALFGGGARQVG